MRALVLMALLAALILAPVNLAADPAPLPDLGGSHVAVPWDDFKKLLEKIQPAEVEPPEQEPEPPAAWVISAAHYKGRVVADSAGFDVTINLTVLEKKEWVEIPLLPSSVAVRDFRLDNTE